MGWFEDQVKMRKELDEKTFEDSFKTLVGLKADDENDLFDSTVPDDYSVGYIFSFLRRHGYIRSIRESIIAADILFVVLLTVLVSAFGLLLPYFTKRITGEVAETKDMNLFIVISVYLVATATGLLIMKAVQGFINLRMSYKIEKSVQETAMKHILSLPTSFFRKYNTGDLTERFSGVAILIEIIISSILVILMGLFISLFYIIQISVLAPGLTLPVILVLFVTTCFTILSAHISRRVTARQLDMASKEAGLTYEIINGIQKIRLSGSEKRVFSKWAHIYSYYAKLIYNIPLILRLNEPINLTITVIGNIAIYIIAAKKGISVGNYMAFVSGYGVLSATYTTLSQMAATVATASPYFEMIKPVLEEQTESDNEKLHIESISGNIKLENVSFRYSDSSRMILDDLSLDIKEGEYIAIVGQSGCGKSTLVRLLLGFESPVSGRVLYDGTDIRDLELSSLRRNIGTVIQNGTLFHSNILENILISAPELNEEDAWRAAEIAGIADDIREMPMKMKTVISEGQGGISGGQKQRIMIARAIVHRPKVLIFDEATSALDNVTQKNISDSISKLNCTRIVIAHRLSTIKNADRIIMLENGKIVEEGSYDSLISIKGRFAELVERQRPDIP